MRIAVIGSTGRMGKEVCAVVREGGDEVCGEFHENSVVTSEKLRECRAQVVIDFSLPANLDATLKACIDSKTALVSGVTGLSDQQRNAIADAGSKIPVLYSANMSLGIQILLNAMSSLGLIPEYKMNLVIEESHHLHKRDRPSGTAVLLKNEIESKTSRKVDEMLSLRGGQIVGDHRIIAMAESETLVFQHTALNRKVFADGAWRAARWVSAQTPGHYKLEDYVRSAVLRKN